MILAAYVTTLTLYVVILAPYVITLPSYVMILAPYVTTLTLYVMILAPYVITLPSYVITLLSYVMPRHSARWSDADTGRISSVAVVAAFFICWAPFHAQRLMAIYAPEDPSPRLVFIFNVSPGLKDSMADPT